ncbi:uncharacterized protein MONOS_3417 [Monocercomonoides exilis]|uniref:uncharacterized protein n=1 Tax=Monocercomonoides exilis TaxID=2049356 RepID=UPI003559FA2D|nr:hypothetical protein MONOS_3417 [Monocercomonoides exilis]|eukprot:MONOS_3417.1-p1 / transcript=MONOS_3417.1 / gene=MONOS_3417 / organism=Monocercomonoides_exilis_PA203 / gene_product=unspecified product / transcript_product=unspecified product / location=Mono_scaffold00080:95053-96460(-) / protein_length=430 / sequence_SO=supercontig / SO=protein_coding / is_pseudo=false
MSYPIYIWNLTDETTPEQVIQFFGYCGPITSAHLLILEKNETKTRIIQLDFKSESSLQLAQLLQGVDLNHSTISVSDELPKEEFGDVLSEKEISIQKADDNFGESSSSSGTEMKTDKDESKAMDPELNKNAKKIEQEAPKMELPANSQSADSSERDINRILEPEKPSGFFSALWKSTIDFTKKTTNAVKNLDEQYHISDQTNQFFSQVKKSIEDVKISEKTQEIKTKLNQSATEMKKKSEEITKKAMENPTVAASVETTKKGLTALWAGVTEAAKKTGKFLIEYSDLSDEEEEDWGLPKEKEGKGKKSNDEGKEAKSSITNSERNDETKNSSIIEKEKKETDEWGNPSESGDDVKTDVHKQDVISDNAQKEKFEVSSENEENKKKNEKNESSTSNSIVCNVDVDDVEPECEIPEENEHKFESESKSGNSI